MDTVTQQNAASSEENASASEELSAQAENLNEVVRGLTQIVGRSTNLRGGNGKGTIKGTFKPRYFEARKPPKAIKAPHRPMAIRGLQKSTAKEVKPEDVIPMDAAEDFKDF